jgi:hypothetical protein
VSPEAAAALEAVALRLQAAGVEFLLGGSGLLHAHGVPVEVGDIDLVLRVEDRERLEAAAGEWWRGTSVTTTPFFRSPWKATLDVGGVRVDALGGLAWAVDGQVVRMPFRAAGTWRCGAADVPLSSVAHWGLLYERYKPERAAQAATVAGPDERARALAELGLA